VRDGSVQVAAAWAELLRLVRPLCPGDLRALTAAEVAATCTARLGPAAGPELASLAASADAAAFGAAGLPDRAGVDAWAAVARLAPTIRRVAGRRAWLAHRLTLR
jgi:hypothetical protein